MNAALFEIVKRLLNVKDDVDAIDHHQTDRIVVELKNIVAALEQLDHKVTRIRRRSS